MARRSAPSAPGPAPKKQMTPAELRDGIARLTKRREEVAAFDVGAMRVGQPPELAALSTAVTRALEKTFGEDTADCRRFASAARLAWQVPAGLLVAGSGRPPTPVSEYQDGARRNIERSVALLGEAIRGLEEDLVEQEASAPSAPAPRTASPKKVFVVHGHDEAALQAVGRFLEKIGLEAIILREQPDQGLTIIEKFEACASEVGFAVVLLTPDDVGGAVLASQHASRARQNVVFELGYFAGKLGRGRACLLRKGDVEIPSDLYGVIYTDLDAAEGWKMKLVKELKAAKLDFDANKVWT